MGGARPPGAAGIDRHLAAVEQYGSSVVDELAADLKAGSYRPPGASVLIPKPGTVERRPLSIPTVRDRSQAARRCSNRSEATELCRSASGRGGRRTMLCGASS